MVVQESGLSVDVADQKIREIYRVVEANQEQLTSFGFSRGFLGISVFNYLYSVHAEKQQYVDRAREAFFQACDMIDGDLTKSYPQDFAELGLVAQYLVEADVLDLDLSVFLEDIDTILLQKMRYELRQKHIGGFVNGALGYGLYFLQRARYDQARMGLIIAELVDGILASAIQSDKGCYWQSKLKPSTVTTYLSFPHGSAAILLFLAKVVEMGLYPATRLQRTISDAVRFLEAHRVLNDYYQFIDIVESPHKSRLALCYGDMGIGYMLIRIGTVFANETWALNGLTLLKACTARRQESNTGVQDASVLFGATGLALLFDRVGQLTGEISMHETANFWYTEVLRYGYSSSGYAGFRAAYNQWHLHTNLAFSEGIIGIGCGLIKALNPNKLNFDDLIWLY